MTIPTIGELRQAYRTKSSQGDTQGLEEIDAAGCELNRLYRQEHPDHQGLAPDDYSHPQVEIERELVEVKAKMKEPPQGFKITVERSSENERQSNDYGLSM